MDANVEDGFLEAQYEDRTALMPEEDPDVWDLDDRLGYDADHSDPSQYCRHGTWIGSWWGPDYLCGMCESGAEYCETCKKVFTPESHSWYEEENDVMVLKIENHDYCVRCLDAMGMRYSTEYTFRLDVARTVRADGEPLFITEQFEASSFEDVVNDAWVSVEEGAIADLFYRGQRVRQFGHLIMDGERIVGFR